MNQNTQYHEKQEPRMFVGGLFPETTSETLRNYFSTYGEVKEVKIIGEKQKRSRGFGFVLFTSMDTFHKVIKSKHMIDGREVDCNLAVYSNETKKDEASLKNEKKIFIKKVPTEIEKKNLIEFFSKFGEIEKVLLVKRKNKDHAFAFVEFEDSKVAKSIIESRVFYIEGKHKVECEMAQPKIRNYLNKVNKPGTTEVSGKKSKKKKKKNKKNGKISKNSSNRNSRGNSAEKRQRNEISVSNIVKDTKDFNLAGGNQFGNYTNQGLQNYLYSPTGNQGVQYVMSPTQFGSFSGQKVFNHGDGDFRLDMNLNNFTPQMQHQGRNPAMMQQYMEQQYQSQQFGNQFYSQEPQFMEPIDDNMNSIPRQIREEDANNRNDNGPRFIHSGSGSISFKSNSSKCSITQKIFTKKSKGSSEEGSGKDKASNQDENLRFNKSSNSSRNSSKEECEEEQTQQSLMQSKYLHPNYMVPIKEQPLEGQNMFCSLGPQPTQPQIIRDLKRQDTQPLAAGGHKYADVISETDEIMRNPKLLNSNITPKLNEIIRPFPQPNVIYSENNSPFVSTLSGDSFGPQGVKKAYSARFNNRKLNHSSDPEQFDYDKNEKEKMVQSNHDLISITLDYKPQDEGYGDLRKRPGR